MLLLQVDPNTMTIVVSSVAVFIVVVLLLVAILLYARYRLIPSGNVVIDINSGEHEVSVPMGGSLLSSLSNSGVFLPSACGGGGTCGTCRCQVHEGGGAILPTETGFFSRREQQADWRLACQVRIRDNVKIEVPESVLGIKKWECEVVSNNNVATFIKEFVVKLPEGEKLNFKSGGYIQIDVPAVRVNYGTDIDVQERFRGDWDKFKMWDLVMENQVPTYRAYSMANHPAEGNIIMLNVRIATPPFDRATGGFMKVNPGLCSSYIFSRKPGDKVNISGPYGEFFLRDTDNEMVFIGGGAGMAPMRSHLFHLFKTLKTDRKVSFWYGARSRNEIFYEEDFRAIEREFPNFSFHIALSAALPEDKWEGPTGFIHQVLYDEYLKDHEAPEDIEYYMCGPGPMTASAKRMLDSLGVEPENIMFDDFG